MMGAAVGGFMVAEWSTNRRIRHQLSVISSQCEYLAHLFTSTTLRASTHTYESAATLRLHLSVLIRAARGFSEFVRSGPREWSPIAPQLASQTYILAPLVDEIAADLEEQRTFMDEVLEEERNSYVRRGGRTDLGALPIQPSLFQLIGGAHGGLAARARDLMQAKEAADAAIKSFEWWTLRL